MVASLLHLILTLATQAAMKESLDAPQPAMADEDDPLLAEAIRASLVETEGGAEGGAEGATDAVEPPLIQRFPALKAQLEAEQRQILARVLRDHRLGLRVGRRVGRAHRDLRRGRQLRARGGA